jgi:hypothetical protein
MGVYPLLSANVKASRLHRADREEENLACLAGETERTDRANLRCWRY